MSLRRSARSRNVTEESSTIPQLAQVVDNSPRKRKRGTEGSAAAEETKPDLTSPSNHASAADADRSQPQANLVNGESRRGPPRVRVRNPRNPAASGPDSSRGSSSGPNGVQSSGEHSGSSKSDGLDGKGEAARPAARKGRTSATSIQDLGNAALPSSKELFLEMDDAEKLRTLLQHFAPGVLDIPLPPDSNFPKQASDAKGKGKAAPAPSSTLADALDGRRISLRQLRAFVLALLEPLSSALVDSSALAKDASDQSERPLVSGLVTLLSLVDEIATRARQTSAQDQEAAPIKAETCDDLEALLNGSVTTEAPRRYALHMRLPNGDYFTKATSIDAAEAVRLDTGLAELIAIEPHVRSGTDAPPPSLGSRRYRDNSLRTAEVSFEELRERRLAPVRPTNGLYYGCYASFAPTYDSSDASISNASTALVRRMKLHPKARAAKATWTRPDSPSALSVGDIPPPPPAPGGGVDIELPESLDDSIDSAVFRTALEEAERSESIERRLKWNADLLGRLQQLQWDRIRKGYARAHSQHGVKEPPATRFSNRIKEIPEDHPSEKEQDLAQALLKSLGDLVALRPRLAVGTQSPSLIPSDEHLHALSHSAAIDPALSSTSTSADKTTTGYWGTFDPSLYNPEAPQRLAGKVAAIVPTFASNDTARMDTAGESAAHAAAVAHRGLPLGVSRERGGKGMLDRVAGMDAARRQVVLPNPPIEASEKNQRKSSNPSSSQGIQQQQGQGPRGVATSPPHAMPVPTNGIPGLSHAPMSTPRGGMPPPPVPLGGASMGAGLATSPPISHAPYHHLAHSSPPSSHPHARRRPSRTGGAYPAAGVNPAGSPTGHHVPSGGPGPGSSFGAGYFPRHGSQPHGHNYSAATSPSPIPASLPPVPMTAPGSSPLSSPPSGVQHRPGPSGTGVTARPYRAPGQPSFGHGNAQAPGYPSGSRHPHAPMGGRQHPAQR